MNRPELMRFLRKLDLPEGQWVVFGGAVLAANDIRDAADVDIFVTSELYEKLRFSGWTERKANSTGSIFLRKICDGVEAQAFMICGTSAWIPDVERYIESPSLIDGMPFMSLTEMYEWKAVTRRTKDVEDLALIEPLLDESAL